MKVADLVIGKTQNDVLTLTGKNLAKMYRKFGVTPTFSQFMNEQSLLEVKDVQELRQVHKAIVDICQQNQLGIETVNFSDHFQRYVLPGGERQSIKAQTIVFVFNLFVTTKKSKLMEFIQEDREKPTENGIEVVIKCNRLNTILTIAIKNSATHIEFISVITKNVAAFKSDDRPWTRTVYV